MKQPRLIEALRARLATRRYLSKVWVFNNIPAGARVDTEKSCPLPQHLTERALFLGIRLPLRDH